MTLNDLIKTAAPQATQPTQAQPSAYPISDAYKKFDESAPFLKDKYNDALKSWGKEMEMSYGPKWQEMWDQERAQRAAKLSGQPMPQAAPPPPQKQQAVDYQGKFNEILQRNPWMSQQMGSMPGATPEELYNKAYQMEQNALAQQTYAQAGMQRNQELQAQADRKAQAEQLNQQQSDFWNQQHQYRAKQDKAYEDWYNSPEQQFVRYDQNYKAHQANREAWPTEINTMLEWAHTQNPNMTPEQRNNMYNLLYQRYGDTATDVINGRIKKQNEQIALQNDAYARAQKELERFHNDFHAEHAKGDINFNDDAFVAQWEKNNRYKPGTVNWLASQEFKPLEMIPAYQAPGAVTTVSKPTPETKPVVATTAAAAKPKTAPAAQTKTTTPAVTSTQTPNAPQGTGEVSQAVPPGFKKKDGAPAGRPSGQNIGMMGWAKQNPTLAAGIAALLVGGLALAGTGGGGKRESSLGMLLALLLGGGTFLGAQKLLSVDDAGKAAGDAVNAAKASGQG